MAEFNADFWEISTGSEYLENLPSSRALWYETQEDRSRRYAFREFFEEVSPVVHGLIGANLTKRQQEVVELYYVHGKTQEDIATILDLTQSTVSRHLFGTMRRGKKVGGAIPKLRKVIDRTKDRIIDDAFGTLQGKLAAAGDFRAIRAKLDEQPYKVRIATSDTRSMGAALVRLEEVDSIQIEADGTLIVLSRNVQALQLSVPRLAQELGVRLLRVEPLDDSLESVFSYLVER